MTDMKYPFLLVTNEGPTLMTQDEFEAWVRLLGEDGDIDGITEILDELPFDYETLKPHQAVFMAVEDVRVNLKTGAWKR